MRNDIRGVVVGVVCEVASRGQLSRLVEDLGDVCFKCLDVYLLRPFYHL